MNSKIFTRNPVFMRSVCDSLSYRRLWQMFAKDCTLDIRLVKTTLLRGILSSVHVLSNIMLLVVYFKYENSGIA